MNAHSWPTLLALLAYMCDCADYIAAVNEGKASEAFVLESQHMESDVAFQLLRAAIEEERRDEQLHCLSLDLNDKWTKYEQDICQETIILQKELEEEQI